MNTQTSDPAARLAALTSFAARFPCGESHGAQVVRLACQLFRSLGSLHGLGAQELFWLHAAAIVHDIGWVGGGKEHHKRSMELLLAAEDLPFDPHERLIIGNIARYHRRAIPDPRRHARFACLPPSDRQTVARLAAILRLADGLDAAHQSLVEDLRVEAYASHVRVICRLRIPPSENPFSLRNKSDLFEVAFGLRVDLEWTSAWEGPP